MVIIAEDHTLKMRIFMTNIHQVHEVLLGRRLPMPRDRRTIAHNRHQLQQGTSASACGAFCEDRIDGGNTIKTVPVVLEAPFCDVCNGEVYCKRQRLKESLRPLLASHDTLDMQATHQHRCA